MHVGLDLGKPTKGPGLSSEPYKGTLHGIYYMVYIIWYKVYDIWYIVIWDMLLEVQGSYNQAICVGINHL